jgi:hypothetical protein
MPPTLGQGAGCTLMNAYVLNEELSRGAIVAYPILGGVHHRYARI